MLEYIKLHNFQKYADYERSFNEKVNYITGVNGAGKSTILRAIMWVALNSGESKNFIRTYNDDNSICAAKEVSAEIGVDGHVVKRVYSSSKNEYYVDGLKITGFGKNVPEEVSNIFKMSDLNYSEQFSPLFLINDSGNSLATELGEVASLEEMEELSDSVNASIRAKNVEIQGLENTYNESLDKMKAIDTLPDDLEAMDNEIDDMVEEYNRKEKEINELESICNTLEKKKDLTYLKDTIDSLEPEASLFEEDIHLVDLMNTLTKLKSIPPISQDVVDSLNCDIKESDFECSDVSFLENIVNAMQKIESDSGSLNEELADIDNKLSAFAVCPYCGSDINKDTHTCQN